MEFFIYGATFIFGAIIGSFLNVVILRYNTGKSIGNSRSMCLCCGQTLTSRDLIPIVSYLIQRGKCNKCSSKISIQYPLVEILSGLSFVSILIINQDLFFSDLKLFLINSIFLAIVFSILLVIFVYDIKHKIIPDLLVFLFSFISLVYFVITTPFENYSETVVLLDLFAGPILFIPFYLLWKVSSGKWIGLGDGKLALGIGFFLGFVHGISAIFLAFLIGAIVSSLILLIDRLYGKDKNITMKTEIPFAPFLIIGILIIFFFPIDLIGIGTLLYGF
jgi:leader peptidase (prepilin peptidase)/N-methyltransferase